MVILTGRAKGTNQIVLRIGLAVLLVAVIIVGSIFIGGESSLTRFAETAISDDITTNRSHIWSVTLETIKNHWFFGAGIGAFAAAYTPYDTFSGIERVEQAHNDYLQILADAGIIGLILAGFFVFKLFQTGFKNFKTENLYRRGIAVGALTGCFSILVHSIFDFVLHTTAITVMFLTLVSLLIVSGREFEDDEKIYEKRTRRSKATVTPIETGRKKLK
jgi:O-antigen ligase